MEFSYEDLCNLFDQFFDDVTPEVVFGYLTYQPSDILKSVDPIAYREEVLSYINTLLSDGVLFCHDDGTYHDCD